LMDLVMKYGKEKVIQKMELEALANNDWRTPSDTCISAPRN
jgi:hypothetical protein